jgi:hypothetical protein
MRWTKNTALTELHALAREVDALKLRTRGAGEYREWFFRAIMLLDEVFGRNSREYRAFVDLLASGHEDEFELPDPVRSRSVVRGTQQLLEAMEAPVFQDKLESARAVLRVASRRLAAREVDEVYDGRDTPPEASAFLRIIKLSQEKLRPLIRARPSTEREVQDAYEQLLTVADVPFSREAETFPFSSKGHRPDFTVPRLSLAIELKLVGREGREREVVGEIAEDIIPYQKRYSNIIFVVYDLGFIREVERFTTDFEDNENVFVLVVKH